MVVGLAVLAILGCTSKAKLDTVPVSGTVTLDDKPVDGARVAFTPTSTTGTAAASGVTDANGRYKLTTRNPGDGALPGNYLVMISKTETGGAPASEAIKPGMSDKEKEKAAYLKAGKKADPKFTDLVPPKYKNPGTSGFKAEVTKGGKNEFDFPMTSK
jgi:hypothetical protein